jgi:hypothetical protein
MRVIICGKTMAMSIAEIARKAIPVDTIHPCGLSYRLFLESRRPEETKRYSLILG